MNLYTEGLIYFIKILSLIAKSVDNSFTEYKRNNLEESKE